MDEHVNYRHGETDTCQGMDPFQGHGSTDRIQMHRKISKHCDGGERNHDWLYAGREEEHVADAEECKEARGTKRRWPNSITNMFIQRGSNSTVFRVRLTLVH